MDLDHDALARTLPDYQVLHELGRGQFGVVWAGRHRHLARSVAIKQLLLPDDLGGGEHSARFRREARILAGLNHPHVVTVYDYREEGELRLLVMEHLDGGTLGDRNAAGLDPPAQLTAILAAATGLHHVHQAGILHRDVKPDNLMFDGRGALKVTDFGVARGDIAAATSLELSHAGQLFGTPAYVSPEQAEIAFAGGTPTIGPAADLYGLAAVYYELLTGELTHSQEGGLIGLSQRRISEPARPVRSIAPDVHPTIEAVVMQALHRDPDHRFRDLEAFAVALSHAATEAFGHGWLDRSEIELRDPGRVRTVIHAMPAAAPTAAAPPDPAPAAPRPPSNPVGTPPMAQPVAHLTAPEPATAPRSPSPSPPLPADRSAGPPPPTSAPTSPGTGPPTAAPHLWSAPTPPAGAPTAVPNATPARRKPPAALVAIAALAVLALVGVVLAFIAVAGGDDDPGERDPGEATDPDAEAEGESVDEAGEPAPMTTLWKAPTGGNVFASPTVDDALGQVVVGSEDGNVYAFDAATGAQRWSATTGGQVLSSAAISGDTYVVGSYDGHVYALDRATGTETWRSDLGFEIAGSPAVAGDTIVVGADRIYGLAAADGTQRWAYDAPGGQAFVSSPAVDAGVIVAASTAVTGDGLGIVGVVHGIEVATGAGRWTMDRAAGPLVASPRLADGIAYVGDGDGTLWGLAAADGSVVVQADLGSAIRSSAALADGIAYVGTSGGELVAIDVATDPAAPTEVWTRALGGAVDSSPLVLGDLVVVGCNDAKVYAIRRGDGTVASTASTGGPVLSSPRALGEGAIVGSSDDAVHALGDLDG